MEWYDTTEQEWMGVVRLGRMFHGSSVQAWRGDSERLGWLQRCRHGVATSGEIGKGLDMQVMRGWDWTKVDGTDDVCTGYEMQERHGWSMTGIVVSIGVTQEWRSWVGTER